MLKKTIPFFIITAAALLIITGLTLLGKATPPTANPPQDLPAADLQTQKQLIISYIESANSVSAQAEFDNLVADFGHTEDVVPAVYDIAETYRHNAKFEQSLQVYQDVVTKWPAGSEAVWAQRGLAVSNIALDKMAEAQAELDKLKKDYSADPNIAEAVFNVADAFYWFKHYEKANELYQHVLNTWPGAEHATWAQMGLALSNIAQEKDADAETATQKLLTDYAGNLRLPEALFYIAGRYEWSNKFKQAKSIYQQIAQQYPESPQASEVPFALARVNVSSLVEAGDNSGVLTAVDELIIDFNDRPDLPAAISRIEEIYYDKILAAKPPQSEDYLGAVNVWEKAIQRFPDFFHPDPDLYYFIADCYHQLGEYEQAIEYFQKVVDNFPDHDAAASAQLQIAGEYESSRDAGLISESEADPRIEEAYRVIVEKYPDCVLVRYALLELGRLNFRKARWAEAVGYLELFLGKYPENQRPRRVLYALGRAYDKVGELSKAKQAYAEFIDGINPGQPHVQTVKQRLEELEREDR